MKKPFLMLSLAFLASSCTINLQIDTDYASQNNSDGEIQEKVTTEATATTTPTIDANVDTGAL